MRIPSTQGMTHVAWSCDGKKLAAVGIDKNVRIWQPEKSVSVQLVYPQRLLSMEDVHLDGNTRFVALH